MANTTLVVGDRVRFTQSLSNGGTATWTAVVVRLKANGLASVRHPARVRTIPFSPVPAPALYLYRVSDLLPAVVR